MEKEKLQRNSIKPSHFTSRLGKTYSEKDEFVQLKNSIEDIRTEINKFSSQKPIDKCQTQRINNPSRKNCKTCNLLLSQGISSVHCKRHVI